MQSSSRHLDFRHAKEKEGLPTTHQETIYALPTQRKISIGRNDIRLSIQYDT